jgi:hypothetical protein
MVHCKNLYKCHKVPLPSTTIKKKTIIVSDGLGGLGVGGWEEKKSRLLENRVGVVLEGYGEQ